MSEQKAVIASLANLSAKELEALVDEVCSSPPDPAAKDFFDKLLAEDPELQELANQLEFLLKVEKDSDDDSFVGRVFVSTTMVRTTTNSFAVVIDETDATVFYKSIGRIVSRESSPQSGIEFPNLAHRESVLGLTRKQCERGRKVIRNDRDGERELSFRSRGESWSEWDGQGRYFDHLW